MLAQGNSSFHFLSWSLKIKKMDDCMQTLTGKASYKGPLALSQTPSCTKIQRQLSLSTFFSSCKFDMLFQPINRFFSPSSHIVRQELFSFLLHNIFGEQKHWMSTQTHLSLKFYLSRLIAHRGINDSATHYHQKSEVVFFFPLCPCSGSVSVV